MSGPVSKLVVGFPPGGNIDLVGRLLGQEAAKRLHKTIIVEARLGAGGALAAETVARAQPDGNTLLLASSANAVLPAMSKGLRYDAVGDFEWIGTFTRYPLVVSVPRNSPYNSFADLLKAARDNPGKITFASAGLGTTPHLVGEMIANAAKVKFLHVPYKGEMPSMVDAIGGQVDFVVLTAPTVLARLRSGELRALAVTGETRWRLAPSTPTVAETGHPGFSIMSWVGLAAPKGTPAAEVARLSDAFQQAQQVPEIRQQIEATGVDLYTLSPAQTRELMQREVRVWRERVTAAGLATE
jgi:tripartite-type tricarboxylate transporter receptor subunit TctC